MKLRAGALGERNFRLLVSARTISFFWIGAAWILVTTAIVIAVRDVRRFELRSVEQALAPAPLPS